MSNARNVNKLFLALVFVNIGVSFAIGGLQINITMTQNLIISQLMMLVPSIIYLFLTKTKPTSIIPFKKIRISTILMVVLFTFLAMPFMSLINVVSQLFVSNATSAITENIMENSFWFNILLLGVMPAISEEFICRGVFYGSYRKSGVIRAAIITGAVFGLLHMNLNQFSYAIVLGFIFCLLMEATGTILAPIIAHFIINSSSVVMLELQKLLNNVLENTQSVQAEVVYTRGELLMVIGVMLVFCLMTVPLAVLVYIWISKHCNTFEHIKKLFFPKSAARQRVAEEEYLQGMEYYGQQAEQVYTQSPATKPYNPQSDDTQQKDIQPGRIVTPALIAAIVICFVLMIWMEL